MCDKNQKRNWVRRQSTSRPGHFYLFNTKTGEKSWLTNERGNNNAGVSGKSSSPTKSHKVTTISKATRTPAQDRLKNLQNRLAKDQQKKLKQAVCKLDLVKTSGAVKFDSEKNSSNLCSPATNRNPRDKQLDISKVSKPKKTASATVVASSKVETFVRPQLVAGVNEKKNATAEVGTCVQPADRNSIPQKSTINPNRCKRKATNSPGCCANKLQRQEIRGNTATSKPVEIVKCITKADNTPFKLLDVKVPSYQFNSTSSSTPISANERLQRLRSSLQSTPEQSPNSTTTVPSALSNISANSPDQTASNDVTPMELDLDVSQEIIYFRSEPSAAIPSDATLSDYYDVIKENLLKISSETSHRKLSINSNDFYLVIDTNVFLQNLAFLEDLSKQTFSDSARTVLIVPYVVLQELDRLKQRKHEAISTRAVRAIKYLNGKFEAHDQSVQGQSSAESSRKLLTVESADDSILNCCLQIKERAPRLLLLSNDVNLRNKAMTNAIKTCTKTDLELRNF